MSMKAEFCTGRLCPHAQHCNALANHPPKGLWNTEEEEEEEEEEVPGMEEEREERGRRRRRRRRRKPAWIGLRCGEGGP